MDKQMKIELTRGLQEFRLRIDNDRGPIFESQNLRVGRDGYTRQGVYYGIGAPVYSIEARVRGERFEQDVRANDRHEIMRAIREVFPAARWFNQARDG